MKYAHVVIEIRFVGHGAQVDVFNHTLATRDGQGVIHRTDCFDFADSQPIADRAAKLVSNATRDAIKAICR